MRSVVPRLSLADLSAAGVLISSPHAVGLVRWLIDRVRSGELPGIPSVGVIRFSDEGLTIEGPIDAAGRGVALAAQLVDAFAADAEGTGSRVPGPLRLVLARAAGTLDLPPYASLDAFSAALARFAAPEPPDAIARALAAAWARVPIPAPGPDQVEPNADALAVPDRPQALARFPAASPLTVSDIRRARRATGMPLTEIALGCGIAVARLRELEWGDLRRWPAGFEGRGQVVRYARAAGLDELIVLQAVEPLLVEQAGQLGDSEQAGQLDDVEQVGQLDGFEGNQAPPVVLDVPVALVPAARAEQARPIEAEPRRPGRRARAAWAAGVAATVLAGVLVLAPRGRPEPAPTTADAPRATDAPSGPSDASPARDAATGAGARSRSPDASRPAQAASAGKGAPPAPVRTTTERPRLRPLPARPASGLPDDATAWSPTFNTAGSAMFYHAQADGRSTLMRADTDGRGSILQITRVLDDRARNFHARPSPDGKQIAFDSDRDGERAVYVADADGRHVRRVSGDGFAAIPSWSPDGRRLAFVRAEPGRPRVWNLWTLELETGQTRRVTNYRYGQLWGASWFPDGRRIAYSHEDRLYVRALDGDEWRAYPSPVKGRLVRTPAVSPDGRRIIFQVFRDGAWLLDLRTGSSRKVLWDPSAEEYTWAPDGRRVAFHSRRSGSWGIWVMAAG